MMTDYKTPPGDLGLISSANRAMSAQLTSIRGAMDGAMRAAGDLPDRIRMLVSENSNLRAENESLRGSIEEWRLDMKSMSAALASAKGRLAQKLEP
jgi:regulator of replication initiation timing